MPKRTPHHEAFWRFVHSEDRRARVEGPSEGRVCRAHARFFVPASGACALCTCATTFPSSASSGHPLSSARRLLREDTHCRTTDRPRSSFRRRPAKERRLPENQDAVHHHEHEARGEALASSRPSCRFSRSRRPHFFPRLGKVLLMGIARSRCGHPRIRELESTDAFLTRWNIRAWD